MLKRCSKLFAFVFLNNVIKTKTMVNFCLNILANKQRVFGSGFDWHTILVSRRYVHPVCLPRSISDVIPGTKCWITGFGSLSSGGSSPDVLMQASVPIISQSKCKQAYGRKIHNSMICAGYEKGGIDSCQGDSGGPMVCESGGRFYLHGAISWGHGCATPGKYGVYARVKYHGIMDWIQETMKNN